MAIVKSSRNINRAGANAPARRSVSKNHVIAESSAHWRGDRRECPWCNPLDFLLGFDLITPNLQEATVLLGLSEQPEPVELAHHLRKAGFSQVVVTLGSRGCLMLDGKDTLLYPALPVKAVDTTGAGDIFNGALAIALSRGSGGLCHQRLRLQRSVSPCHRCPSHGRSPCPKWWLHCAHFSSEKLPWTPRRHLRANMVILIGVAIARLSWSRFAGALASAKTYMVKSVLLQCQESLYPNVSKGPTNAITDT